MKRPLSRVGTAVLLPIESRVDKRQFYRHAYSPNGLCVHAIKKGNIDVAGKISGRATLGIEAAQIQTKYPVLFYQQSDNKKKRLFPLSDSIMGLA